jgi:hypothetical protein
MVYVLVAAIAAGAVAGGVRSLADSRSAAPAVSAEPEAAPAPEPMEEPAEAPSSAAIEGTVLEALQVANYSYYRLGERGSEGTWVAVPTSTLKVGDHARVVGAAKMMGFKSTTLDRTFPVIWFGTLEGSHGHAGFAGEGANPADPHAQAAQPAEVKPVERARGGKTVAEIIADRTKLAGKKVRLRATVVKSTPGVLGKTWLHLRDGSGAEGSNDVAATTQSTPAVGATITVECSVALDRDVGAGYRFPTLLEDCTVE